MRPDTEGERERERERERGKEREGGREKGRGKERERGREGEREGERERKNLLCTYIHIIIIIIINDINSRPMINTAAGDKKSVTSTIVYTVTKMYCNRLDNVYKLAKKEK